MRLETKYKIIEKLILTDDEALLSQVEEILEGSDFLSEELKQELDKRMEKYQRGESKLYSWEEVKEHIKN